MNNLYERYEHLRNLVSQCHEEEYEEYLKDYPTNPFMHDKKYLLETYNMIMNTINDVIASGSCDDMLEILYYLPKAEGILHGRKEILWDTRTDV